VLRPFSFDRAHPYAAGQHRGVDIGAPTGSVVLAPAEGVVSFAGTVPGGGKTVSIQTLFGYTATLCISPNEMIVHGIPTDYAAREGDIISIDLGVTLDGMVADSAYTFPVGEISDEAQRLLDVCQEALEAGIEKAVAGNHLSDISHAIQTVVEGNGFSVVRALVGHGVGREYHEDPQLPNFGPPGRGPKLAEGMTLAIEPMITAGGPDIVLHSDEWSISTEDQSLAAHFEHTVAVTEGAPRILTAAGAPLLR
jgi:methionyl aminopeptidase